MRQGERLPSFQDNSESAQNIFHTPAEKKIPRTTSATVLKDDKYPRLEGWVVAFLEGETSAERQVRSPETRSP